MISINSHPEENWSAGVPRFSPLECPASFPELTQFPHLSSCPFPQIDPAFTGTPSCLLSTCAALLSNPATLLSHLFFTHHALLYFCL